MGATEGRPYFAIEIKEETREKEGKKIMAGEEKADMVGTYTPLGTR